MVNNCKARGLLSNALDDYGGLEEARREARGLVRDVLDDYGDLGDDRREVRRGNTRGNPTRLPRSPHQFKNDPIRDLELSMRRWGITREGSLEHKTFWNRFTTATKNFIHGKKGESLLLTYTPVVRLRLPADPKEGVQWICKREIDNLIAAGSPQEDGTRTLMEVEDQLLKQQQDDDIPYGPPYSFDYSTRSFQLKPAFQRYDSDVIDPLVRFVRLESETEQVIRKQYQQNNQDCIASCNAMVLRAMVAHAACNQAACKNCGAQKTLLFNNGEKDSVLWRRFECSGCGALYEIKSLKDIALKINEGNMRNVDGGSLFGNYHLIKNREPMRKIYLAMVDSQTFARKGPARYNVYVAEIKQVTPFLKPRSFPRSTIPRIYSKIFISPPEMWFHIVACEYPIAPAQAILNPIIDDSLKNYRGESKHPSRKNRDSNVCLESAAVAFAGMKLSDQKEYLRALRKKRVKIIMLEKKGQPMDQLTIEERELLESKAEIFQELKECESEYVKYL